MQPKSRSSRLECIPGIPLSIDSIGVISSAKEFHDKVFQLIEKAEKRIYLSALYLENDKTGQRLLDALYAAKEKKPDISITVLVDFHRAQRGRIGDKVSPNNAQFYMQRNQKSKQMINIYGLPVKGREFFGVMHLKGFVFDDLVLYSGASINDIYFHTGHRYRYDRYTLIKSVGLANSLVELVHRLHWKSGVLTALNRQSIPSAKSMKRMIKKSVSALKHTQYKLSDLPVKTDSDNYAGNQKFYITPVLGMGRRGNRLNKIIIDMIRTAQSDITLYTPYFNFPSALKRELKKALHRQVKVTLVIGDKTASDFYIHQSEKFSVIGALPYLYEMLLRGFMVRFRSFIAQGLLEIRLWKHDENSFHVKGVSVDQQYYLLTGNNLNPRAWGLDLENALLINDKQKLLTDMFCNEHEGILTHTKKLTVIEQLEHPRDYPLPVKKILSRLKRIRADKVLKHFI